MQVKLIVTNKASKESTQCDLLIEDKVTIGRHLGSPVILQGDGLSRHHFSLSVVEGALAVEDLSSNGTWLNGTLLRPQTNVTVKTGDVLEVPNYEMQITDAPKSAEETPATHLPLTGAKPAWAVPLQAASGFLEPRELALLVFAMAAFVLVTYVLNS